MMPKKLCELRKSKGLTQLELSNALGVNVGTYQKWEYGTRKPNAIAVKAIEEYIQNHIAE